MPPTLRMRQRMLDALCQHAADQFPDRRVVCGDGSPGAQLMVVGEAPGRDEARLGHPFVGRAGHVLDELLTEAGIRREEVWITNVVKERPTVGTVGSERNRPPTAAEIQAYLPTLGRELEIIQPPLLLCLGNVPAGVLICRDFKMTRDHGRFFPGPYGSQAMATYHPAYLLRLQGESYERVLEQVRADLRALAVAYADL